MFKKILILFLVAVLAFGMVSCVGGGVKLDSEDVQEVADYEKFIKENGNSVVLKQIAEVKGNTAEEKAEDYINSYKGRNDNIKISEDVLALYTESFKALFANESADDIKAKATDMIMREMAVYRAYNELGGKKIDTSSADEMNKYAKEMADKYGYNVENIYTAGGDTYLVETYIKYQYIISQFQPIAESSSVAE